MATSTTPTLAEILQQVDLTESMQTELRALLITMVVVPTVIILIRAWSRALLPVDSTARIPSRFWWDDWTAFIAAAFNIVVIGLTLKLVHFGLGLHVFVLTIESVKGYLKFLYIIYFVHTTGMAIAKTSVLLFYTRVFGMRNPKFKYAVWSVHAMNIAWVIGTLLSVTFICNPISKAWEFLLPGTCLNFTQLWLGNGLPNLIIDIFILVLPVPMLWQLKMKWARKLQIIGVFACGYLVVVSSIGRLYTTIVASEYIGMDPTWVMSIPTMWLGSEIAVSLVSMSLPSIYFLVQRAMTNGVGSLVLSRTNKTGTATTDSAQAGGGNHYNGEGDREMASRSRNQIIQPHTKTTAEYVGPNKSFENLNYNGIHVVSKTEIA